MPIPVITVAQMREWEKASWAAGKSESDVIRQVGRIVAQAAMSLTGSGDSILILAGKGHNGEDARYAREHLNDRTVELLAVKDPDADFPKLEALLSSSPALVIDGLFGIGINRPLETPWIKFIERINAARLTVLAVDVPSGLNADSGDVLGAAIEAAMTLTIGAPKIGLLQHHASRYVGRLVVAKNPGLIDCPFQGELNWIAPKDFRGFPPRRPVEGHKGTFGHLAIVAGSLGYHGAAVLASRGAQRAQPGLITLFAQERAYIPIASQLQAVMVHVWPPPTKLPANFSAILVGPGLAAPDVPEDLTDTVRRLWRESAVPVIADASALDWLPMGPVQKNALRVVTPHPGEAARLLKSTAARVQADRKASLRALSRQLGNAWVVLKGHQTLIGRADGPMFVNSSGNPFLGQGGSGDSLSGYLAGLLAQRALQEDPGRTIRFAVWQHGAAADLLSRTRPNWIVEDLLETLGSAGKSP
ncbi:MAG TPA: NAD(P)H-hydrate dehydratase [Verrucomicrobiae bacterium]|jgi:NAD(P)H-hydrate epimerase|nr:NAD(P)H-hydrate dehydratase [Verrucomicrobiae bacterium]